MRCRDHLHMSTRIRHSIGGSTPYAVTITYAALNRRAIWCLAAEVLVRGPDALGLHALPSLKRAGADA
jgi:hypothetical protein